MASNLKNIYPEFDRILGRSDKETHLKQGGFVLWLYGLSGSGKSTLASALERRLHAEGFFTQVLDGDNIRSGLNSNLGFSDGDRRENIRRVAEVAKLFLNAGVVTITAFITPTVALRKLVRQIIGSKNIFEVYVKCSFDKCVERDPKGLYAKVQEGRVKQFTGKDSLFEEPEKADLVLDTEKRDLDSCIEILYQLILPKIRAQ